MKNLRDRDFLRACRRIISESPVALQASEVARRAALTPAPAFYLSYGYALRRLRYLRRRGEARKARAGAPAVFAELDRRVDSVMHRRHISDAEALAHVLAEGNAPCYYLLPGAAAYLYCKLRKRARQRRRRSLNRNSLNRNLSNPKAYESVDRSVRK